MPYAGIMSTPVIDTATNIIYVVGACSDGTYDHWIFHALNLLTATAISSPVGPTSSYPLQAVSAEK